MKSRPTVVVGHDERSSSPELVAGVLHGLRQMGCGVIDLGPAITPHLWMNVLRFESTGGILVSGAGCDPSYNGLEFVGPNAAPISHRAKPADGVAGMPSADTNGNGLCLEVIAARAQHPWNRPTRSAGFFRTVRNLKSYERTIRTVYHALRPLRVVVGTGTALLQRIAVRLFESLPCELVPVHLPMRARILNRPDDADVFRVTEAIQRSRGDVGILIDDDGQTLAVLDETGALLPSATVTQLLAGLVSDEHPGSTFALEETLDDEVRREIERFGGGATNRSAMSQEMHRNRAVFGGGCSGR